MMTMMNTFINKTDNHDIATLRARIMRVTPSLHHTASPEEWWLLGTVGCHLCDDAEQILARLAAVYPIKYHYVDIADFDEPLMMHFATTIPVILTPSRRLNYPFSVVDLQQLWL